ncbi:MAG: hypothetical protein GEU26_07360 [Nitrososphaeraceae archaeon]|nr:hypothetical protein [Nitrososphaeraceae archaeon]
MLGAVAKIVKRGQEYHGWKSSYEKKGPSDPGIRPDRSISRDDYVLSPYGQSLINTGIPLPHSGSGYY